MRSKERHFCFVVLQVSSAGFCTQPGIVFLKENFTDMFDNSGLDSGIVGVM